MFENREKFRIANVAICDKKNFRRRLVVSNEIKEIAVFRDDDVPMFAGKKKTSTSGLSSIVV